MLLRHSVNLSLLAAFLSSTTAAAQTRWDAVDVSPPKQSYHAMVYDPLRARVLLFGSSSSGGAETWEWDGSTWTSRNPTTSPSARSQHAMCYDAARHRVVLFGGNDVNGPLRDTWEWDGSSWSQANPVTSPIARWSHTLAFDPIRTKVILFGGMSLTPGTTFFGDTWEWDGVNWTQLSPATSPSQRARHAMVLDPVGSRIILHGGTLFGSGGGTYGDTWSWDGATWTRVATAGPVRTFHALAYDTVRSRIVTFGGNLLPTTNETWEWDGSTWSQRFPPLSPPAMSGHAMAFHLPRNEIVLFGNDRSTWRYDGTTWLRRSPPTRDSPAMAYDSDRGRVVLFGGHATPKLSDTWEWDGIAWTQVHTPTSPSGRVQSSMVYDSARKRIVLFGGEAGDSTSNLQNDTWEYDGITWTQRSPVTRPSPRNLHVMAYDAGRGRTVLFSGSNGLSDLWEWDGNNWQQRFPVTGPGYRIGAGMVYDSARGRSVLFGGANAFLLNDTWEWDGTSWQRMLPAASPPARYNHSMAFDLHRRRTVIFGGNWVSTSSNITYGDTWEWDGLQWTQRIPLGSPPPRQSHVTAYHAASARIVLFGGSPATADDTWNYGPAAPAAFDPYGAGCAGGGGTPALAARDGSLPWLGETFEARLSSLGGNPSSNVPFLLLGDSKSQWGTLPLPLDLTPIGMPGCFALTSGLASFALTNQGGTATWSIPVPGVPSLAGISLYVQGGVTSPGTNPLGLVLSNGCALRIGAK